MMLSLHWLHGEAKLLARLVVLLLGHFSLLRVASARCAVVTAFC